MPIFGKKFNFRDDAIPADKDRFGHLSRIVQPGVAIARAPEMKGSGTTVVFLPYPNFENKNYKRDNDVLDDRIDDEPRNYNPWIFYADGVVRFGKSPVSLLFDNPDDAGFIPSEHHPVHMIYDVLFKTVKNKNTVATPFGTSDSDRWDILLNGVKGAAQQIYPAVKRPQMQFMTYALVYVSKSDNYVADGGQPLGAADNDKPVVFVMSQDTVRDLLERLDQLNAQEKYVHPEITGSKFVHFYDKQVGSCPAMQAAAASQRTASGFGGTRRAPSALAGQQKPDVGFGYATHLSETFSGRPAGPQDPALNRRDAAALACAKLLPWEKTLRGYSPEECARVVGDECALPDSLLYHAWKSNPDFYPDQLKLKLKNPKSFVVAPPAAQPDTAPDGAQASLDGDATAAAQEAGSFSPPPFANGEAAGDDEGVYDPAALKAAADMFRSKVQETQTANRPGGNKPPSRR